MKKPLLKPPVQQNEQIPLLIPTTLDHSIKSALKLEGYGLKRQSEWVAEGLVKLKSLPHCEELCF